MKTKVTAFLTAQSLLRRGDTVTCALSGGADSVAMTHLLWQLRDALGITVRACHFNHHLRGSAGDGDERFCVSFCDRLGIPLVCGNADTKAYAAEHGESIEEAARHCRYAFFRTQPGLIATAHTADDDLETVLLALLRGTGLKGLCGIPPRRERFLRPLLTCTRADVLAYLEENGLEHREDATNGEDDCVRNRLRHHTIPLLKAENPSLAEQTARMTDLLRQDELLLQTQADALLASAETEDGGLRTAPLRDAPRPLVRRALRTVLTRLGVRKLSSAHLCAAESLLFGDAPSKKIALPDGLTAERCYELLRFSYAAEPASFQPVFAACPFELRLSDGARLTATAAEGGYRLRADAAEAGLTIRPRQTGDRLCLHGVRQTVKKRMIDKKIPRSLRESYPVILCGDTVAAAFPFGIDDAFLAADGEKGYRIEYNRNECAKP